MKKIIESQKKKLQKRNTIPIKIYLTLQEKIEIEKQLSEGQSVSNFIREKLGLNSNKVGRTKTEKSLHKINPENEKSILEIQNQESILELKKETLNQSLEHEKEISFAEEIGLDLSEFGGVFDNLLNENK